MSELQSEFPGKVRARNVDATTPESAAEVRQLGFQKHGLVIRSSKGKVLWKQADHSVTIADARAEIQKLLSKTPKGASEQVR